MSKYPKLIELYEAVIEDCYNYYMKNHTENAKNYMKLLEINKNKDEIIKKSFIVSCSINNIEQSEAEFFKISEFSRGYLKLINQYINNSNKYINCISTINDCCISFIVLFGYIYILKDINLEQFLLFPIDYYLNYYQTLDWYKLIKVVQLYFDYYNQKSLFKNQFVEFNDNYFTDLIKFFQNEILNNEKKDIDIKLYENTGVLKTLSSNIQNREEKNTKIDNRNLSNKTSEAKIELLIKDLEKTIIELKNDLKEIIMK